MTDKIKLNARESRILTELIKDGGFMTTAEVATEAEVSWNTALQYLKKFRVRKWVERRGATTLYWRAIVDEL